MMHIKLPRKKVMRACELIAEECSEDIARLSRHQHEQMVRWRRAAAPLSALPVEPDFTKLLAKRSEMEKLADMCDVAVGCVYVSPELWKRIRVYYK